jgi:hypothetical protein
MSTPRIDCVFYTSPATLAGFLSSEIARPVRGDFFIELGLRPALAYALNLETPALFPGLAGLLGGLPLADLALNTEHLPCSFVPAPGAPVSVATLRAALVALRATKATQVTLLVSVEDAPSLGAVLHTADRFALAWDALAHPETSLADFARWLKTEALLTPTNFLGLLAYSAQPLDAPAARHSAQLTRLFTEAAPTITAAHPDLILPGA